MNVAYRCGVLLLVLVALFPLGLPSMADALSDYWRGVGLQSKGAYRAAIAEFGKVAADSPLAAKAYCEKARCYRTIGNLDDAIASCGEGFALAGNAQDRLVLATLLKELRFSPADTMRKAGELDRAIGELQGLLRDYPEDAKWVIAQCYVAKGDFARAQSELDGLLITWPTSRMRAAYEAYRARCWFRLGREADAREAISRLVAKYPDDLYVIVENADFIGDAMLDTGRLSEAKSWYQYLLDANPRPPAVIPWKYGLARTLYDEKSWEKALALFQEIVVSYDKGPWHPACLYYAGSCSDKLGDGTGARKAYQTIISQFPDAAEARAGARILSEMESK